MKLFISIFVMNFLQTVYFDNGMSSSFKNAFIPVPDGILDVLNMTTARELIV